MQTLYTILKKEIKYTMILYEFVLYQQAMELIVNNKINNTDSRKTSLLTSNTMTKFFREELVTIQTLQRFVQFWRRTWKTMWHIEKIVKVRFIGQNLCYDRNINTNLHFNLSKQWILGGTQQLIKRFKNRYNLMDLSQHQNHYKIWNSMGALFLLRYNQVSFFWKIFGKNKNW